MPIFEIETDQGVFEIDADREPTQEEALQAISAQVQPKAGLKASTQETLSQQDAARQAIIQREQRPASQKVLQAAGSIPSAIMDIGGRLLGGIPQIPALLAKPETIIPTVAEGARRTGVDIVRLGEMLRPKTAEDVRAMGMGPTAQILNAIAKLNPRTPTESEIEAELSGVPLLGRAEDISTEREKIAFEGANPAVSESLSQAIQLASPIKGVQALKAAPKGLAGLGRSIRTAVKPKGKIANQLERAAKIEGPEIFLRNPNADKLAASPFEGFANEVKGAFEETGARLSEIRALSGSTLNAGDEIADKILDEAIRLEEAGKKTIAAELLEIANETRGSMTNINSLQDAVTIANRKPNILNPKTTAQGFADEIISKEGGSLVNKELEAVKGAEGAAIRKKWSNLKILNDNVQERVNKIINSAPADAQPAIMNALTSVEGAAGLFALVQGYAGGIIPVASSAIKSWAKREAKALKNADTIIERKYDELRRTSPAVFEDLKRFAPSRPPPIPDLAEQIGSQL